MARKGRKEGGSKVWRKEKTEKPGREGEWKAARIGGRERRKEGPGWYVAGVPFMRVRMLPLP